MYLSAQMIDALEGVRKEHFLNAGAVRTNRALGDAVGLKNLGVHLVTVEPGHYSTELHAHLYEEECVYILAGTATATLGDKQQTVGRGDFLGYPTNGEAHDLYNDGEEPLVCLVIGQRLDLDICDYPRLGKRLYRYSGQRDLVSHEAIGKMRR